MSDLADVTFFVRKGTALGDAAVQARADSKRFLWFNRELLVVTFSEGAVVALPTGLTDKTLPGDVAAEIMSAEATAATRRELGRDW